MNYFDMPEYIEPRCPKCSAILNYGVNTEFKEDMNAHVCISCGQKL